DRNRSHWSTSKTPSYTKSVSWQHHHSSLILYKPEFERKSCATVRTTIVAATATINGKDVELLKAGAIEQKW
ncbi:hypothetical protein AB7X50_12655, partial [Escherichia coli]